MAPIRARGLGTLSPGVEAARRSETRVAVARPGSALTEELP
jgi:hypothetical protein